MDILKQRFQEVATTVGQEVKDFLKLNGDRKIDEVVVSQVFGGMRGIKSMLWETSQLIPKKGYVSEAIAFQNSGNCCPNGKGEKSPCRKDCFG